MHIDVAMIWFIVATLIWFVCAVGYVALSWSRTKRHYGKWGRHGEKK